MRGLDLETTETLLGTLRQGLNKISNRLAALAPDAPPELGDAIGFAAVDLDRHLAIVEALQARRQFSRPRLRLPPTRVVGDLTMTLCDDARKLARARLRDHYHHPDVARSLLRAACATAQEHFTSDWYEWAIREVSSLREEEVRNIETGEDRWLD